MYEQQQFEITYSKITKLGFTKCILPLANLDGLADIPGGMQIVGVSNVAEAINELI